MDPLTWAAIAVLVAAGAGFGAGWGLKPDDAAKALEAQAATLDALTEGQSAMLENATRPIVIDAEIRDKLADTPPACLTEHGDPASLECMVQMCWQYGQSAAQRPACQAFETELVRQKAVSCPDTE